MCSFWCVGVLVGFGAVRVGVCVVRVGVCFGGFGRLCVLILVRFWFWFLCFGAVSLLGDYVWVCWGVLCTERNLGRGSRRGF